VHRIAVRRAGAGDPRRRQPNARLHLHRRCRRGHGAGGAVGSRARRGVQRRHRRRDARERAGRDPVAPRRLDARAATHEPPRHRQHPPPGREHREDPAHAALGAEHHARGGPQEHRAVAAREGARAGVSEGAPASIPAPPGDGQDPGAAERRRRFIERTLEQRRDEDGRAVLAAEWRYIGPLLAGRAPGRGAPGAPPRTAGPGAGPDRDPAPGLGDVLDLACGSGHQTLAWSERGYRVTGLDFDRDLMLAGRARLARAGAQAAAWTQADATSLPFRSASFDLVFNNSLLEHVPAWRAVLAETARVLRPGGVFVMYTTNRACPIQQEVNHFPFYPWLPDPLQRRVLAWIMR